MLKKGLGSARVTLYSKKRKDSESIPSQVQLIIKDKNVRRRTERSRAFEACDLYKLQVSKFDMYIFEERMAVVPTGKAGKAHMSALG